MAIVHKYLQYILHYYFWLYATSVLTALLEYLLNGASH